MRREKAKLTLSGSLWNYLLNFVVCILGNLLWITALSRCFFFVFFLPSFKILSTSSRRTGGKKQSAKKRKRKMHLLDWRHLCSFWSQKKARHRVIFVFCKNLKAKRVFFLGCILQTFVDLCKWCKSKCEGVSISFCTTARFNLQSVKGKQQQTSPSPWGK